MKHFLQENWFRVAILLFLAAIVWQLSKIKEDTAEIRDGIEVQIVDAVDWTGISIPSVSMSI
ncbi:hypothetical protein EXS57_02305 [Candidatus Kaiserbacteria bacterium]|nr:hypothetical protein [Candidatus Kaiserbacteria bacterium]